MSWRRLWTSHARTAVGVVLGAAAGAAYSHFVGCRTGTCPLTADIRTAAAFFGLVGGLAAWPSAAERARAGAPQPRPGAGVPPDPNPSQASPGGPTPS